MTSILFWENSDKSVIIKENSSSLVLSCNSSINNVYKEHFTKVAIHSNNEGLDVWTFEKNNDSAMSVIGQVIGNTNIKASFKVPNLNIPPINEFKPITQSQQNTSNTDFILKIIWESNDKTVSIVEYSTVSIALFCDKDKGNTYSEHFKQVKGKFNYNLKYPNSTPRPGWIFSKNSQDVFQLLQQLTGTDIKSLMTSIPEKKSWNKSNNQNSFQNNNPVIQPTILPTPTVLPGMGLSNFSGPNLTKIASPAVNLNSILDSLSIPMERVQRTTDNELIDNTGDIRIGMWGPINKVENEMKEYIEQYGQNRVKEKIRITVNNNMVVILIRSIE
jgi:hypothetical protein